MNGLFVKKLMEERKINLDFGINLAVLSLRADAM